MIVQNFLSGDPSIDTDDAFSFLLECVFFFFTSGGQCISHLGLYVDYFYTKSILSFLKNSNLSLFILIVFYQGSC